MIKTLSLAFSGLIEFYFVNMFFKIFMEKKFNTKKHLLILSAFAILQAVNSVLLVDIPLCIVGLILITVSGFVLFKGKAFTKIISAVIIVVANILFECSVSGIVMACAGADFINNMRSNPYLVLVCIILSKAMTLAFIVIVKNVYKKSPESDIIDKKSKLLITFLPIGEIIMILLLDLVLYNISETLLQILFAIASFLMLGLNIITIEIIDRQAKIAKAQSELEFLKSNVENQERYYRNILNSQEEIRRLRHDTKNFYIAAIAEIEAGNTDMLKESLKENLENIETSRPTIYTGHPALDSVIQSKLIICDKEGIKTDIKYFYKENININEMEIAVILGNLFDNAIEANEKAVAVKYINLTISVDGGEINIVMTNPSINENANLKTTKKDTKNHGYGIKSIKTIADKYRGSTKFEQDNNEFNAYINLKNEVQSK